MSEDNYNNVDGEETAALFVSAQKKKKAEAEARERMEAEQARRDAAEAEVRRMEQEVEERKRRAEEERRALEEAERAMEEEKSRQLDKTKIVEELKSAKDKISEVAPDLTKIPSKEEIKKDPKKFIIIGAAAAAVIIIAIVAVFALKKGKKPAIDYATVEFAKEYTVTAEGLDLKFLYPEEMYTEISEDDEDEGCAYIDFTPVKESMPSLYVSAEKAMGAGEIAMASPKDIEKALVEGTKNAFFSEIEGANYLEEVSTDVSADDAVRYEYKCTVDYGDGVFGSAASWIAKNSKGDYVIVGAIFDGGGENADDVNKLRDTFYEKNSADCIKLPGNYPPESTETDGVLEADSIHMGIIVPKDRFKKIEDVSDDEVSVWADDNGALYVLYSVEFDYDVSLLQENHEEATKMFKSLVESIGSTLHQNMESRMFLNDQEFPNDRLAYRAEYKDIVGGIPYWEGTWTGTWNDLRTKKQYLYSLSLLAPEKNGDVYKGLFDRAVDMLKDI
ncbi:MAG: hypothetical protein IKX95_00685 [Lachnospiraceae bacterium]|nr:hypothetical protein [Lachnospiraceae bacterium]